MAPAALSLVDVVKRYAPGVAVGPASLDVKHGEFFSLLGESGSGKTTLLRCIAGFETLTSGAILLNGAPIHAVPAHRRNVGLVFQNYALFPHRTVGENVAYGLQLRKVAAPEIKARVQRMLEMVGLQDLSARYPSQISGGQQQRVAIARALVLEPPLVLFDEPLSNLDAKLRVQLRFELRSLQRRLGMTCVFVTHDQSEALGLSDRLAVLAKGSIAQIGTPSEIYDKPASALVAEFVGSSNRFTVQVVAADASGTRVRSPEGLELHSMASPPGTARAMIAMFRPEQVAIVQSADRAAPNTFDCTVEDLTYLGEDTHLRLICAGSGQTFLSTFKSNRRWAHLVPGAPVAARIDPDSIHLFEA